MIEELEKEGIKYKEYNNGALINALDQEGIIQSFYPTTGTIVLHASNDKKDHRTKVIRNKTIEQFIKGIKVKNLTKYYFKGE